MSSSVSWLCWGSWRARDRLPDWRFETCATAIQHAQCVSFFQELITASRRGRSKCRYTLSRAAPFEPKLVRAPRLRRAIRRLLRCRSASAASWSGPAEGPTEYKVAARRFAPNGELPSDYRSLSRRSATLGKSRAIRRSEAGSHRAEARFKRSHTFGTTGGEAREAGYCLASN
jgi:hypothetical protein